MEEKKKEPKIDYSLTKGEIKFSDRVKLRSNKNGFLLTFAQTHPEKEDVICVSEIYLSPEVAASLATIFMAQVAGYEKKFNIKISPPGVQIQLEETKNKKTEEKKTETEK